MPRMMRKPTRNARYVKTSPKVIRKPASSYPNTIFTKVQTSKESMR